MLNPNLQAPPKPTPTEKLVDDLSKNGSLDSVPTSDIAFIGSDKENVPRHRFPDNCLRPAIEKWFDYKREYPQFLSLSLGKTGGKWTEKANRDWIRSIAGKKIPVVLFHPNPTAGSSTANEINTLLDNGYSWCTFENGTWTEPSGAAFPFRIKTSGPVKELPFPPTLFFPKETNVETWKTDLNKIIPVY